EALAQRDAEREAIGLREGQRPYEQRAHRREHGRVRADAEREDRDRDGREAGAAPERPQRVPRVGEEVPHRHSVRSAIMGSTRAARRAGRTVAKSATTVTPRATATKVVGSPPCTP